jgi:hypothetical protein
MITSPSLCSNHNPLHLIECHLIPHAVVEIGRARGFVRCNRRRVLKRSTVFEICRDTSRAKRVAARGGGESLRVPVASPSSAHPPRHRIRGETVKGTSA